MSIYTILKLIAQAIKSIRTSLSAKVNNYYYTSGSVAATKSATFTVCSLTVPKTGVYLVLGGVDASISSTTIIMANITYTDASKADAIVGKLGRATMNSGGGVHAWHLTEVKSANAKINLVTYGYPSVAWTARGSLIAIRLI